MTQDTLSSEMRRTTMVDTQVRPSDVTKFPIIDALLRIPREAYVPEEFSDVAYADAAIEITQGRELMEPRCFAKILDALDLQRSDLVLIIGGGLGYSSAVIGQMVDSIVMVEEDAEMAGAAERTLSSEGVHNAAVLEASLAEGAVKAGPYDVIFIEGSVSILPDALADQLADGGRVVAGFAQGHVGEIRIGHKSDGRISWRSVFDARLASLPGFEVAAGFAL